MYPVLQRIEADARLLLVIDSLIFLSLLTLLVCAAFWAVGHINRWERRQEAQVRAFTQIAAAMSRRDDRPGEIWADVRPGKSD